MPPSILCQNKNSANMNVEYNERHLQTYFVNLFIMMNQILLTFLSGGLYEQYWLLYE